MERFPQVLPKEHHLPAGKRTRLGEKVPARPMRASTAGLCRRQPGGLPHHGAQPWPARRITASRMCAGARPRQSIRAAATLRDPDGNLPSRPSHRALTAAILGFVDRFAQSCSRVTPRSRPATTSGTVVPSCGASYSFLVAVAGPDQAGQQPATGMRRWPHAARDQIPSLHLPLVLRQRLRLLLERLETGTPGNR